MHSDESKQPDKSHATVSFITVRVLLGRVDTKPNNASFRQNFTHPALKGLDRRQPACDFLPCLHKIYARKREDKLYLLGRLPRIIYPFKISTIAFCPAYST